MSTTTLNICSCINDIRRGRKHGPGPPRALRPWGKPGGAMGSWGPGESWCRNGFGKCQKWLRKLYLESPRILWDIYWIHKMWNYTYTYTYNLVKILDHPLDSKVLQTLTIKKSCAPILDQHTPQWNLDWLLHIQTHLALRAPVHLVPVITMARVHQALPWDLHRHGPGFQRR